MSFPGEQVPGPWHENASVQGPGHPLKTVSGFKPLLPKCQLRLLLGINYSPQGCLALLNALIKVFISRKQILGPRGIQVS